MKGSELKSLKEIVGFIKPKKIIPIHAQNAKIHDKLWNNVHLLKTVGEVVEI